MRSTGSFFKGVKAFAVLLRDAYREFQLNDPLRMAAATSFFASFALPPILIILVDVFGFFGNPRTIRRDLLGQLTVATDKNIVSNTREILKNVHYLSLSRGMQVAGFIFLLFVATTLFEVIRNSLNQLWKLKRKKHQSPGFVLLYRAKSTGIIMLAGILFSMVLLGDARGWLLPDRSNKFLYHAVTLLAVMGWFILILKYLSDGRPAWPTALAGGIFTGVLFTIGEIVLHTVLLYDKVETIYGASSSLVLLLLFVFYCSFIFYYGACFTQALGMRTGRPIVPTRHAIITDSPPVPTNKPGSVKQQAGTVR